MSENVKIDNHRVELLAADVCITWLSGVVAYVFNYSMSYCVANLGPLCRDLSLLSVFYLCGFLLWKTYNSFERNLASNDFLYTVAGLLTGVLLSSLAIRYANGVRLLTYRDVLLQFIIALVGLRVVRNLISIHYYYYSKRSNTNGSYGLNDMALLNMELSELLSRSPIKVDEDGIMQEMSGKRILVTGGAGSIGSELVKNIARYGPKKLIVIDQAETPMHDLILDVKREFPALDFICVLGDVCNKSVLRKVFERFRPQILFHAAAYKHVSMMEENPSECILNNVCGTMNAADLAVEFGTEKFVLISSDKAVKPTGMMGCSKRICEIYCQSLSASKSNVSNCQFVTTRFGNVLGSNGSVVPLFREQIRRGGPVTVTHPDVIRYFMLIDEACKLVLEAATLGHGGEIFVFDMGMPVRITDLAKKMIRISRRSDIEIKYIGLGKGEKLYEEVLTSGETEMPTLNEKIRIAHVRSYDFDLVNGQIRSLVAAAQQGDGPGILAWMREMVPEFTYTA